MTFGLSSTCYDVVFFYLINITFDLFSTYLRLDIFRRFIVMLYFYRDQFK